MSSHHSRRFFNLHHDQMNAAGERKSTEQAVRLERYWGKTRKAKLDNLYAQVFGVFAYGYIAAMVPAYLYYILRA